MTTIAVIRGPNSLVMAIATRLGHQLHGAQPLQFIRAL